MQIRLNRFLFDEKDLFAWMFGLFLLVSFFFNISVYPFRFSSLLVLFFYLLVTRSIMEKDTSFNFLMIVLFGFVFSTFLSPYGLLIYLLIATILYKKTHLL